MATDATLASALALALTGERIACTDPATLVSDLAAEGFPPERLAALRAEAQEQQRAWPTPVAIDTLREIGFARFDAALAGARRQLGLDGLIPAKPAQRQLNRDEQRLAADRPPHWG